MGRGFLRFDQHLMRSLFFVKMEDLASFFSFPIAFKWERIGKEEAESFLSPPLQYLQNEKTMGFPDFRLILHPKNMIFSNACRVFLEVGVPQNQQNPLVSC